MSEQPMTPEELLQIRVDGWICLYGLGLSLQQIASRFGVNWQTVRRHLRKAGVEIRPRHRQPRPRFDYPPIDWNGSRYTWSDKGYYRRTQKPRSYLHYDIWELHHGPVPDGFYVCHLDGDPRNNDLENLVIMTTNQRSMTYKVRPARYCLCCGSQLVPKLNREGEQESLPAFRQRLYCNPQCKGAHRRGKPRTWKALDEFPSQETA